MSHLSMLGARIFYKKLGSSGIPLLFIHGGGCTHYDWEKQLEGLKHNHVVIACDLRGHGQSTETDTATCTLPQMATDVGQMIYTLGLDRPILVGHSYGTRVAILRYRVPTMMIRLRATALAPGKVPRTSTCSLMQSRRLRLLF
jgi:pimeloyl-ACP methyl ester carboxylesterase